MNIALGSAGELLTRMIGLKVISKISVEAFEEYEIFQYKVENKLLALVKALQSKRKSGNWDQEIHEPTGPYNY